MQKPKSSKININEKLKVLGLDKYYYEKQFDDKIVEILYEKFLEDNEIKMMEAAVEREYEQLIQDMKIPEKKEYRSGYHIKTSKCNKVTKSDPKYVITLEFLNALLKALGKEEIIDITNFRDIRRDDLLKDECNQALQDYLQKIIEIYGKSKIVYDKRDKIDSYIITVIKALVDKLGYDFTSVRKQTFKKSEDKSGSYCYISYRSYSVK